jgi:hypothetical protein
MVELRAVWPHCKGSRWPHRREGHNRIDFVVAEELIVQSDIRFQLNGWQQ